MKFTKFSGAGALIHKNWISALLIFISVDVTAVPLEGTVSVSKSNITLADVLKDTTLVLPLDAFNLSIGRSPRAGVIKKIDKKVIQRLLHNKYPEIRLSGPEVVEVKADFQKVDTAFYAKQVRQALLKKIASSQDVQQLSSREINLHHAKTDSSIEIPEGRRSFVINKIMPQKINPRMYVNGSLFVDGQHYQSMQFAFDVRIFTDAWKVIRSAKKGDRIERYAERSRIDVTAAIKNVYLPVDVSNLRFSHDIKVGQLLKKSHVESIPFVEQGREVTVVSKIGKVMISTTAIAKDDGHLGDIVKLYRNNEDVFFNAKVIELNTVSTDAR